MPYRQVIRAKKLGGKMASHARQHAQLVATSATALFPGWLHRQPGDRGGGLLPEQQFLDLYQFQMAVSEELDRLHAELIVIDNRHAHQLQVARQLREQRSDRDGRVRAAMLTLKQTAEGSFGPGASRIIFEEDPPRLPSDPAALHQMAERAYDILTDPEFALDSGQPGVVINPAVLADGFAEPLKDLGASLTALHDAESAIAQTQTLKDLHLEELETFNGHVARFYEALYVLAGHELLASRLRRSSHVQPTEGEPGFGLPLTVDDDAAADGEEPPAEPNADDDTTEEADA